MKITHSSSQAIVGADDYYPFGLTFNYESEENMKNQYLYQGMELQNELGLDVYSFEKRNYDPIIGQWWQIDPKASERESPYVGMANNPILYTDPLGDTVKILYVEVASNQHHVAIIDKDNETGEEQVIVEGFPEVGPNPKPLGDKETGESGWGDLIRDERTDPGSVSEENKEVVNIPEGTTEEEFKKNILQNASTYKDNINYFPIPGLIHGTGNSNSLVGSVLRASGSDFTPSKSTPGFKVNVLPEQRRGFGKKRRGK